MPDEIIEELWRIKDAIAQEHNYDFRRLAATLKKHETSGAPIWGRPPKRLEPSASRGAGEAHDGA
ncbi:MAG: hypothetical protein L3K26_14140 [Candidatus Hydrogenedentes bacterium]|nr:hypothetical protein [Candidatus Hydrogenedentota bacterium]